MNLFFLVDGRASAVNNYDCVCLLRRSYCSCCLTCDYMRRVGGSWRQISYEHQHKRNTRGETEYVNKTSLSLPRWPREPNENKSRQRLQQQQWTISSSTLMTEFCDTSRVHYTKKKISRKRRIKQTRTKKKYLKKKTMINVHET